MHGCAYAVHCIPLRKPALLRPGLVAKRPQPLLRTLCAAAKVLRHPAAAGRDSSVSQAALLTGMAASKAREGQKGQVGLEHYTAYMQVLATDIDHSSPSLLLFLDKEGRMLFNAGEGMQRMFRENRLRMQKVRLQQTSKRVRAFFWATHTHFSLLRAMYHLQPNASLCPVYVQLDNYFFTRVSSETMAGLPGKDKANRQSAAVAWSQVGSKSLTGS